MRPLSILYVDDDPDIRTIVSLALSLDPAITVRAVESGRAALATIAAGLVPDLLLVDMVMPEMDGSALVSRLLADPDTAAIPIAYMTARARPADLERYRAEGVAGVIAKPFDPVRLVDQVRSLVDRTKSVTL